jgi:hypothetical protein
VPERNEAIVGLRQSLRPVIGNVGEHKPCLEGKSKMKSIYLVEKLSAFTEHWQPRAVSEFNGHGLMVIKVRGAFV